MQSEINDLKRKLKELEEPQVDQKKEPVLSTTKGYTRGRIKDEQATLQALTEFSNRIKKTDLGRHEFRNSEGNEDVSE